MSPRSPPVRRSGYFQAEILCSTEGCGRTTRLVFHGAGPYPAFHTQDRRWTFIEDEDKGETAFLCSTCAEPLHRAFEEQAVKDLAMREGKPHPPSGSSEHRA